MNDCIVNDYIVTCDEEVASWIGNDVDSMKPIVRCKDCELCNIGWCLHFQSIVKPDGFCAWGGRRK